MWDKFRPPTPSAFTVQSYKKYYKILWLWCFVKIFSNTQIVNLDYSADVGFSYWPKLVCVCLGVSSTWELGWVWAWVGWQQALQLALWVTQEWGAQLNSQGFLWAWSSSWFLLRSWVFMGSLLPSFSPQNKHPNISTTRSVLYVAAGESLKQEKNCKISARQDERSESGEQKN